MILRGMSNTLPPLLDSKPGDILENTDDNILKTSI